MNIQLREYEGTFSFELVAETLGDAALLARFSTNVTDKVLTAKSYAERNGSFTGRCTLKKNKRAGSAIERKK